jgi:hypothetical protein
MSDALSNPPHPFLLPLIFTAAPPSPQAVPPLNLSSSSSLPLQFPTTGMSFIGRDVASVQEVKKYFKFYAKFIIL